MIKIKLIVLLLSLGFISYVFADQNVPIEDLSVSASNQPVQMAQNDVQQQTAIPQTIASPLQESLSLDQRVAKLEQQMQNLTAMNLPQRIDQLQQQMQQLQGEIAVQQHSLKLLNDQLRTFYQDLQQQIKEQKTSAIGNAGSPTMPIAQLVTAMPVVSDAATDKDQQTYKKAFNLLLNKQYDAATDKLNDYLSSYPNGKYAANAHYWLGEAYYVQSKMEKSAAEFQIVIMKYASSTKVSDAQYKLAMIHLLQGKDAQAQHELTAVVKNYPNSAAARLSQQQLQKDIAGNSGN